MRLWLTEAQVSALLAHAKADAPREACGLIGGQERGGVWRALELIPVPNTAADPTRHYEMDERALSRAITGLSARRRSLVGIYHSHPAGDAVPSGTDVLEAAYPHTAYVIIGLGGFTRMAAWTINYGEVESVELHIGSDAPEPDFDGQQTRAQKIAIVTAAIIGLAALIVLSWSLLPPAPVIP